MKAYWDSSALVETTLDPSLGTRLAADRGWTRSHAITEVFSALTGKPQNRVDPRVAALTVQTLSQHLDFIDLTPGEMLTGLSQCKALGVRGGHVHDYMHALAAVKSGAKTLFTLDRNDFAGLVPGLTIEQV
jgi:hypothetical protein